MALRTNLGKAIEVASDDYLSGGSLEDTHFILLTDGKVDISDDPETNTREERRILQTVLPELVRKGAVFHPVALSEYADAEFLRLLADESGGSFRVADSAEALNLAFVEALNTAVPQEQVPIEGNRFSVDAGVSEFTALIFWGEGETKATRTLELTAPGGETFTVDNQAGSVRWARESGYDLITVSDPQPGDWTLNGELGDGSRVTVVSDLRMVVNGVPPAFSADTPVDLSIAFFEDREQILNPDFLNVLDVSLTITSEDGRSGTKVLSGETPPTDGTYRDTIARLPMAGSYRIDVVADGQTFARKFSATTEFTVAETPEPAQAGDVSESGPVPEQEPVPVADPEPEAEAIAPQDAEIAPPIDVGAIEEPVADPNVASDGTESDSDWMIWAAAGAGALTLVAIIGWLILRRKQARDEELAAAAAERETVDDLIEPEPVPEVAPETTEPVDEDVPELVPENDPDEIADDGFAEDEAPTLEADEDLDEAIPEVTDVEDAVDAVAEPEVTAAEPPVTESEPNADEPAAEEEDEFGLEDFDLSEFDELPDYDEDGDSETASQSDDDQKK